MSIRIWSLCVVLGALIALPVPLHASGPPMFGSVIVHAFGNDVTTGASYPFNASVFQAFPIGRRCLSDSPYTGNGAPAPYYCGQSTLRRGRPVYFFSWDSLPTGPQPAPLSLPNRFFGFGGTQFSTTGARYTPRAGAYLCTNLFGYAWRPGSLRAGGGPGTTTFRPKNPLKGTVVVHAGAARFGGALGILYGVDARRRFTRPGESGVWTGTSPRWYLSHGSPITFSLTRTGMFYNATLGATFTRTAIFSALSWTTGLVTVYAREGEFTTTLMRSGFDHRSPRGAGSIQLVAPQLTHWVGGPGQNEPTGSIAVMRIVPEPHAALLLAAGMAALVLLHRASRRR